MTTTPLYPCDAIFISGHCTAADARRLRDALLPPPRGAQEMALDFAPSLDAPAPPQEDAISLNTMVGRKHAHVVLDEVLGDSPPSQGVLALFED